MTQTSNPAPAGAGKKPADATQALGKLLKAGVDGSLAFLRKIDPDAAADVDTERRRDVQRPRIVVVGETKRGKSSLTNMLMGVPNLSPVDAAVATASYLEFTHNPQHGARAYIPGREDPVPLGLGDLRDWGTVLGRLPDGMRPPRRIEVHHSAPLLQYLTLIDTPGTGGLDSMHAEVAMDAVEKATALLFVVDSSSPFSKPEMNFLIEASKRVNFVLFALTKVDAYPGWRTILADNKGQLQTHAPRFGSAPWFPVSARLAELAMQMPKDAAGDLIRESRIAELQHALIDLASKGHLLQQANVLRSVRSEYIRIDQEIGDRMKATDPDPADAERAKEERARVATRKRTEQRQWSLALSTETQRARVEATTRLRNYITQLQEQFMEKIDKGGRGDIQNLPQEVDKALYALSVRLSHDLEFRFRKVGERVLAQVFHPNELQHVLRQLNAKLRHALGTKPRRDGGNGDGAMVVMSSAGMAMMAGRGAMAGAGAMGLAGIAGAGLVIPVIGIGLGLAAGAYMIFKRKSMTDKVQTRTWLREVLGEARAALSDEIMHRFTDLQYALTLALDEAIERRLKQLDAHIAAIDKSLAEDKAERAKRKAALNTEREGLRSRIKQVDEVLVRIRALTPNAPTDTASDPAEA
ncbi:dynamin family protein [Dactylosporangium sp. AC04546]|uniref:dynamin family protein n=1 Tax=Dactylosporangium sp. AC04546 TaxID=2862460 RepID=UPI001EDD413E|nr:dynamin family protein [Dactylosporangium sp. AC04546]WVK78182.1 dynamin family protein [Dactylosporangium sp. AC04546]